MYSSEIPTKSPGTLTHPLNPASRSTHPKKVGFPRLRLTALSCRLLCSTSSVLLWDLLSLVFFRSRERSRVQALCVGFAPKQRKGSSDWHSHRTHTMNAQHRVTIEKMPISLSRNINRTLKK